MRSPRRCVRHKIPESLQQASVAALRILTKAQRRVVLRFLFPDGISAVALSLSVATLAQYFIYLLLIFRVFQVGLEGGLGDL